MEDLAIFLKGYVLNYHEVVHCDCDVRVVVLAWGLELEVKDVAPAEAEVVCNLTI